MNGGTKGTALLKLVLFTLLLGVMTARADGKLPNFDHLWDYDHPAKTEAAFRAILPDARASGDHAYLAQLLSQIARAQGLQEKFAEARKTLDQAEALLTPQLKAAKIRCLLERGRIENDSEHKDLARKLFRQALRSAQAAGEDGFAIDAAHMLGIVETGKAALEWNLKAIALAEKARDGKGKSWLGALYNNTGWTYYDLGDYPKALDLLTKAQAVYEKTGSPEQIRIAKYSVGKTLRALGKVSEALAIQEKLRGEMEAAHDPDGYVYEELGECLLRLKRPDEARPYFAQAYELLSKDPDLVKSEPKRLERLKELAQTPK